jgi:hypothetical protein
MSSEAVVQRATMRTEQSTILFPLPKDVDWWKEGEEEGRVAANIGAEPMQPAFSWFQATWSGSVPYADPYTVQAWQEPGRSLIQSFEAQFSLLEQHYTFRRRNQVIKFLETHPFLAPLILEAYERILAYFGPSVKTTVLEVVSDPEAEGYDELFILIQTNLTPDEALARLRRLDQEWWLDASVGTQCLLNIDVEYV